MEENASLKLHHPAIDNDDYKRGYEHGVIKTCKAILKKMESEL